MNTDHNKNKKEMKDEADRWGYWSSKVVFLRKKKAHFADKVVWYQKYFIIVIL